MNTLNNTNIILQENKDKTYRKEINSPVKDFLIANAWLVRINEKEVNGNNLTKCEEAKKQRIYELRDKALSTIRNVIKKYYEVAVNGNYDYDGMPEIDKGMRNWIEKKIWRLLVEIAEPRHSRYTNEEQNDFWAEA